MEMNLREDWFKNDITLYYYCYSVASSALDSYIF